MRRLFAIFLFAILFGSYAFSYDFSAVCESGQTLYYTIISSTEPYAVQVVPENSTSPYYSTNPRGDLVIPTIVTNNGNTYSVTRISNAFRSCTGLTSLTIPSSVTWIDSYAFCGCSGLTLVSIPNSVTRIGQCAFSGCSGLTEVTIPNSVTSIECSAFSGCRGLSYVSIPSSVTSIDCSAFDNCSELTSIIVEQGNIVYDSRDNCNAIIKTETNTLISGCMNTIIPNSVTSIGSSAFQGCSGLTSVTIPNSVTNIGNGAFVGCNGLTSLTIPNSVTSIGDGAFKNCTGLTSVTIPNSVTSIGGSAFEGCSGLESVAIGDSVTRIGQFTFYNCIGLTEVTIPNSVTSIGQSAFTNTGWYNNQLDGILYLDNWCLGYKGDSPTGSLAITEGTKIIGDGAFKDCTGLTSVTFPNSVTLIGYNAFSGCNGLISVTIGNSVTSIDVNAFSDCSGLTSVTIPNSVTSIGGSAFHNSGLISVIIGNSVMNIGNSAFQGCNALAEVYYTGTITQWCGITFGNYYANPLYFGHNLYINNGLVTDLIVPETVTEIKQNAFGGATCLTSVTIPESVTSIGGSAFEGCSGLTAVTIPNSVTSIGDSAFDGCSGLTSVTIPNSVTSIGFSAFQRCSSLTEITIPESVTSIGSTLINMCDSLKTVNFNCMLEETSEIYYLPMAYGNSSVEIVNIGENVTYIPFAAFSYFSGLITINYNATNCISSFIDNTNITNIIVGENVETIPDGAFNGCTGISEIHTHANTPPVLGSNAFSPDILSTATVWTPCQADEDYINADGWNLFSDIQNDTSVNFVVDIQSTSEDMGSATGSGNYSCEAEASLEAIPTEHYHFVQWSDGNTDNPRTITVVGDTTYTATFTIDQHMVMVVSNNTTKGTVSGGGTFDYGEEREIEAIANEGYRFLSWNDNNTDNPRTITVSGDTLYIATFEVDDTPQPVYVTIADTACGSYTWNDETYTETNSYYQTFTASNSADSIVRLDLVIYSLPQPEITVDGILDACNPESASVTLTTSEYVEYNWSTNETTGTATVTAPGNYYVEVVDTNGCHGLSEMATVGYSSLLTVAPQLKYVGLRYSGTASCNMVQWTLNNADTVGVRGFEIYREDTETAIYTLVQRIAKPLQRSWTDPTADFTARAYRYKICAIDECGGMSPMSEPHKTMHLTINRGAGTTWNLIWSHYEGVEFGTYEIYRGTSSRNMVRIAVIPSSINSYTDNTNTLEEGMFYQIKIVGSSGAKNEEFELYSNVVANEYVEDYTISVLSNNENFGVAAGSGTYPAGLDVTLMAIPNDGYEFVSWNDGNTENPRTITVSGNAAYVATFGEASSSVTNYTITAVPANPSQGTVTGGGIYPEGTEITIEAIAAEGYEFISWSDDNTENPRIITVTADAMFIASFAPATDIEESVTTEINIFPNPAKDILNITSSETISEIAIVNVMGQIVKRVEVNSDNVACDVEDLMSGVYVVRIHVAKSDTSTTLSVRKFVKE
ncbi:MAG: leucine-rich repeat domain-containing protein [Bacteroidales bacterium]|nr:leucine-rich repeat domain-containing protein [Bacteroidales bacterium]